MKLEISVTEMKDLINTVHSPEQLFEIIRLDVREVVGNYLGQLVEAELTQHLGRGPYQRIGVLNPNYRNGHYHRNLTVKGIGEIDIDIPRDRNGTFQSQVLPRFKRYEPLLAEDLSLMFLTGISTRNLSLLSKRLLGRKISSSEISRVNHELNEAVEKWRQRDLRTESIKYMFIDGTNFSMRVKNKVEKVPVLVVIGVSELGHKLVLTVQAGDKESASNWREVFKDLKQRGLDPYGIQLGIMDGLSGLENVFIEEFPKAKVQRCQVHVARNVLAKVSKKQKPIVADHLRTIFYAPNRDQAQKSYNEFVRQWEAVFPSAVKSLKSSIDSCLTYYDFPKDEWISLRTTNLIERLNKEFKRRTKSMEIVAGEASCYRLLAFISLKMEISWRTLRIGKVRKNLPFFNDLNQL
jgi:putative transposase